MTTPLIRVLTHVVIHVVHNVGVDMFSGDRGQWAWTSGCQHAKISHEATVLRPGELGHIDFLH